MRFYLREGNKVADRIAKETFIFEFNVPKLCSVVPKWLEFHVGVDKHLYAEPVG